MRSSRDTNAELAKRYNISIATARKWKGRDDAQDRSHRPHTLATNQGVVGSNPAGRASLIKGLQKCKPFLLAPT